MQENAHITAQVLGEKLVGLYTTRYGTPAIIVPGRGTFAVDPDTIRYLGEPE